MIRNHVVLKSVSTPVSGSWARRLQQYPEQDLLVKSIQIILQKMICKETHSGQFQAIGKDMLFAELSDYHSTHIH